MISLRKIQQECEDYLITHGFMPREIWLNDATIKALCESSDTREEVAKVLMLTVGEMPVTLARLNVLLGSWEIPPIRSNNNLPDNKILVVD